MHALVKFDRSVYGSRYWTVRDTGGRFDLYVPGCAYRSFGWPGAANPVIGFRVVQQH